MGLPDGYRARGATRDDIDVIADVLAQDDIAAGSEVVLDADFVRAQWGTPGFDPATDAWVVLEGSGAAIAYAHAMLEAEGVVESWGVVAPDRRGRGIGGWLLDRIEERAGTLLAGRPSGRFRHAIDANDRAAAEMLRVRGLRPVRHFWHMAIDVDGPVGRGPSPEGIDIATPVTPDAYPAIHAVLAEAIAEDWGYHPEPLERWIEENAEGPTFDPSLWVVATADGEPVGALTASAGPDRGWIGELGVRPAFRGRGVGASLLRRSFEAFARRGTPRVLLNVDAENPTGATGLYERAGMRIVKRWDLWERPRA